MVRLLVGTVFALAWLLAAPVSAQNATYKLCPASPTDEFADCTFAQECTTNKDGTLSCPKCKVRRDMTSVVLEKDGCVAAKNGQMQSRFPGTGLKYAQLCGPGYQVQFQRKWASCLDVTCTDTGVTTATCNCGKPATGVPYVAARPANSYDPKLCTDPGSGWSISSATEADAIAIQKFLNEQPPIFVNQRESR